MYVAYLHLFTNLFNTLQTKVNNCSKLISFRVSHVDNTKCIVVTRFCVSVRLCVCPQPHAYTIACTQM